MSQDHSTIQSLTRRIRADILESTTVAGSGHPTTSLSAVELVATLFFGGYFRADLDNPSYLNNDRLIFSKGHAAPLLYALYAAAGKVSREELLSLRKLGSKLEGHPALAFPYTEAPTGSLGQGLAIGLGMALHAKADKLPYRTFVLLGDSEMAEGSVWESIQIASFYKLGNLVGMLDVNRLGQSRPTMLQHDVAAYERRVASFGWKTIVVDGHTVDDIARAYEKACEGEDAPTMIIAKTLKGKGVSFIEDKEGWHGKPLSKEEYERAMAELGEVDREIVGRVEMPERNHVSRSTYHVLREVQSCMSYTKGEKVATRKAYGNALARLCETTPELVVLDAEVSNSTYAEFAKKKCPEKFFEMFIAEQNMVGVALGFSRRGKKPCVSTFAAFLTRAADQIRMSQHADPNMLICGSHAGVSIGEDGPSQMALEDLSLFRAIFKSTVLYPSDAVSTEKLIEDTLTRRDLTYLRTTRKETAVLYDASESFPVGESKTLRQSRSDVLTIVAAGVTLHESLVAADELAKEGISVRVIDLYSIKPIDAATLEKAAKETKIIITVEDHYPEGGLGEAVMSALAHTGAKIHSLAVRKAPTSAKPDELLELEGISARAIAEKVREVVGR